MRQPIALALSLFLAAALLGGCDDTSAKPENGLTKADTDHDGTAAQHGEQGHDEDEENAVVKLTPAQVALAEIRSAAVTRGEVQVPTILTGEVALNQDRLAHILPRVPGYVREIRKTLGDAVRAGDTLAVIDSRELSELKTAYLLARERAALAQTKFNREEQLWKQKITPEQEFFDARQALAEANLSLRAAEQSLQSVGIDVRSLAQDGSTMYRVTTPIDGTVIERNVALGQLLDGQNRAYVVADLGTLWVIANAYAKDVGRIRAGQPATVTLRSGSDESFPGRVTWTADVIDEKTRTLKVRVEVENPDRHLKPGMFVSVAVPVEVKTGVIAVPPSAIQNQRGEAIVFVQEGDGQYARREVKLGARAADAVEIVSGLNEGEMVVVDGGFTLKSESEKSGFEAGHGH
jgi:cobalt-zinc-cadmium efflux system membrane fusion protein